MKPRGIDTNDTNITTRKKSKMAASSVIHVAEQDASLIIDDLLSQDEKDDIKKMLADEKELHELGGDPKPKPDEGMAGQVEDSQEGDQVGDSPKKKTRKNGLGKILEDASLDDLNDVLGRVSERFNDLEKTVDELQLSLEFSQKEVDDLKGENLELRREIKSLKKEDSRNGYHAKELDDKFDKLETQARKRNLIFEGVQEMDRNNKENVQRTIYDIFDQMNIDYAIECDTSYRSGPYMKNRPRPIIVTFLKQSDRDHVFYKRINLKNSRDYKQVWINEDLSPTARRAKTMVRLITKQAQEKGVQCRSTKFSVTVGEARYNENSFDELPLPLSTQEVKQIQIDHKTVAYQSEHAPFSSMYPARVKIGEIDYDTSEQAFQHIKAKSNKRPLLAERLLLCRNTYTIKQMGNEITVDQKLGDNEEEVMFSITYKKFRQNPALAAMLTATGDCELVEATPCVKWGSGATLSSNLLRRHEWKGENRHGKVLMAVRAKLIREKAALRSEVSSTTNSNSSKNN